MKKNLFLVTALVLFLSVSCKKKENLGEVKYGIMTFETTEHDFGIIKQGAKVEYTFKYENTGENDLIIQHAVGSCGCTIPEYSKDPIKPGEKGKIKVSFNSNGKSGEQVKSVMITANTPAGVEKLTIKAKIEGAVSKNRTITPEMLKQKLQEQMNQKNKQK